MSELVTKDDAAVQGVRKHVSAVHVSGELTILERKLVNILLLNAFDELLTKKEHSLPVGILSKMLGKEIKNIAHLKKALLRIMSTPITFDLLADDPKHDKWEASPPLAYAGIENGICTYEYSSFLAKKLANPDIYTVISVGVQQNFSGGYGLALYENCFRYVRVGSTGWITVDMWRVLLGAQAELYSVFKRFSDKVLKPAIAEVNEVSNITVKAEYKRENRSVTAIRFLIERKRQLSLMDPDDNPDAPTVEEIRRTDLYARLSRLGIGGQLAIQWIRDTPERALATAVATEEQAKQNRSKPIKNIGAYTRTVYESDPEQRPKGDAADGASEQKAADDVKAAGDSDAEASEKRAAQSRASARELTTEEVAALAAEFIEQTGATSYSTEKRRFTKAAESTQFTAFRIKRAPDVIESREK